MTLSDDLHLENDWLEAELQDSLDEDFELELEDALLSLEIKKIYREKHKNTLPRKEYFLNLLKLQAELIKLHDWVQATHSLNPIDRSELEFSFRWIDK